jgi:divalent metal cation (Fe/Co/Zn/Cd) transporter
MKSSIGVWTPRLRATADRLKDASTRVAVWSRETANRRAARADTSEPTNPIYLVAAITLGIPALLTIPLIGMNPGIQDGAFSTVITFVVLAAFLVAALFEIKKLVDQTSDEEHH